MEGGDIDGFINKFKILVCHAGYDPDASLKLQKFTDGLPQSMYEAIYNLHPQPVTYDQWHNAALDQQKMWVHLKGQLDLFRTKPKLTPQTMNWGFPRTHSKPHWTQMPWKPHQDIPRQESQK